MFSLFKNKLTVDQAAEALYAIMGKDDKARWLSQLNVIDLTNRFITGEEAPFLDTVFPWIFPARPDGFDGRNEQAVQFA